MLANIAPHLVNLEHFYLAGCSRVTHAGIWAVISENSNGLVGLGMEALYPHFVRFSGNIRSTISADVSVGYARVQSPMSRA